MAPQVQHRARRGWPGRQGTARQGAEREFGTQCAGGKKVRVFLDNFLLHGHHDQFLGPARSIADDAMAPGQFIRGERKLAFPVRKCARGTYVLAYFGAPEKAVTKLRADIALSEVILRSLVLHHEGEMRKEPSRDFEIAGPIPPKRELGGGFAPPREASLMGGPPPRR